MPLEVVDLVWRADAREPGLRFRLYRVEAFGRPRLLAEIPALLGEHDYRLEDLPPATRQSYSLRLIDAAGQETALRTIELVGYPAAGPEAPGAGFLSFSRSGLPSSAAELPPPPLTRPMAFLREDPKAADRASAPPDQPPEARGVRSASEPA